MLRADSEYFEIEAPVKFVAQVRDLLIDLQTVKPWIYWTDFLLTSAVLYATLWVSCTASIGSMVWCVAVVICSAASFRAIVFTHEIAHRRPGQLRGFSLAWNMLCGIPFLIPSFLYWDHRCHHIYPSYGTPSDAEYLFLRDRRALRALIFLLLPLTFPLLSMLRFLLMTPLALSSRRMDQRIWQRASSLYFMNLLYLREYDASAHARARWIQELSCFLWAWTVVGLLVAGTIPLTAAASIYLLSVLWMFVNQVRTLVAHRYASHGESMSYTQQILDSYTFPYGVLPELWAPLGMRYHALHHVSPSLPYHAMHRAHRRLMRDLPADSPYRKTIQNTPWSALRRTIAGDLLRIENQDAR